MIDHVSIGVRDLELAVGFYATVLGVLGMSKIAEREGTVGFGKTYPEIWLNSRPDKRVSAKDDGTHICFRASSVEVVDAFYQQAIELGATTSGEPGYREEYRSPSYRNEKHTDYYAAFVRDRDQNHIEVVTFV
ncbi:MAG: VOC family protein [Halioglobus sp.]